MVADDVRSELDKLNALADEIRQIGIAIAEIRQHTVGYGVDVNSPYCELLDAESLVMSASKRLRGLAVQKEH